MIESNDTRLSSDSASGGAIPGPQIDEPLLSLLLRHQRRSWRRNAPTPVETYLEQHPVLQANTQATLDLIYNEIVLREEVGESPQLEDYLRRFPNLAPDLKLLFEVEEAIQLESSVRGEDHRTVVGHSSRPTSIGLPALPGYEILGELGRGGMGVVYKARQLRLNRIVALKMILADGHASAEASLRFLAEAESIARLHHPHIVQIFAFGESESRPYFEMEYVDGGSLADRLGGAPWSAGDAARLIEWLAHAINEAHRLGIVHRDLKPANILLSRDSIPKIADFGLAKCLDVDKGLTKTQLIVGSPSYMAPEQTGQSSTPIGPGADVYSLGAILYELLTGRPPFQAATVLETLQQVRWEEPIAPRRFQPRLPRDLVTICMKCLQKDPAKRYGSADLLAEDLRRFGSGESILARPVGVAEQLWRWCRREPALALLALVLIAGLIGVTTQWWRAESHLQEAGRQRSRAEENLQKEIKANTELQLAKDREATARRLAQERFDLAMKALHGFEKASNEAALLREPQLEGLRRGLLRTALNFHRELQESLKEDASPEARSQLSGAYARVAEISWQLGLRDEALSTSRRALALVEQLAAAAPSDLEIRAALGACHFRIGFTLRTAGRTAEALPAYEQAHQIQEQLARDNPSDPHLQEVLSWTVSNIGVIHHELGRPVQAVQFHRRAIAIHERLAGRYSSNTAYRSDLAWCWRYLSLALAASGDPDSASRMAEQATALYEELVSADPGGTECRWRLARCLDDLGRMRCRSGRPDDAAGLLDRAAHFYESVARDDPVQYRVDVAQNQLNIAFQRAKTGRIEDALSRVHKAEDLLNRTSKVWPLLSYDMACVYSLCSASIPGVSGVERERLADRAIQELRQAVAAGYRDSGQIAHDSSLDSLRHRAEFQELAMDAAFPVDPFQE
jgi:eukaryotic-like serine/threonine-protein kinase